MLLSPQDSAPHCDLWKGPSFTLHILLVPKLAVLSSWCLIRWSFPYCILIHVTFAVFIDHVRFLNHWNHIRQCPCCPRFQSCWSNFYCLPLPFTDFASMIIYFFAHFKQLHNSFSTHASPTTPLHTYDVMSEIKTVFQNQMCVMADGQYQQRWDVWSHLLYSKKSERLLASF